MSQRAVQTIFNVPRATPQTRLNEKATLDANLGRMSIFTYQQERKLVDYAYNRTDMGIRFGKNVFHICLTVCEKEWREFQRWKAMK